MSIAIQDDLSNLWDGLLIFDLGNLEKPFYKS